MDFHFYSSVFFEPWRWDVSDVRGIGASETSVIELGWRLARRGHNVTNFAPLPDEDAAGAVDRGVKWRRLEDADFSAPGIWVLLRDARVADEFKPTADQRLWLVSQDEILIGMNPERAAKCEKIITLCQWHKRHTEQYAPEVRGKVEVSSNGIKCQLIREVEAEGIPERNPHKLMFASSPDRGLLQLLDIFGRAKERVEDLELHVFYGVDNIEKLIEFNPRFGHYAKFLEKLKRGLDQPGVIWRGRVSQRELYREWLTAGLWCYPCIMDETNCCTALEAQALGAFPIVNPRAALAEVVRQGVFVQGDPNDPLTKARYADWIIRMANNPAEVEERRGQMMKAARVTWSWEEIVSQYEAWALGLDPTVCRHQYAFQHVHLRGKAINIGSNNDISGLKRHRGAVNVDLFAVDQFTKKVNSVDVIADARALPENLHGQFDSAVLGDILEHCDDEDQYRILSEARKCLKPDGRVVITCPDDHRLPSQQHKMCAGDERYVDNIRACHYRRISGEHLASQCAVAGMEAKIIQPLDYAYFGGWGIVAEVASGHH